MELKRIHHVAIICSNYAISKAFYVDILGFPVLNETYRIERDSYKLDLLVGVHDQLELFSFPNPPPRVTTPEACGLRHLAFGVSNIDRFVKMLRSNGVLAEDVRPDPITGMMYTFFRDPDHLPLEVYEE